MINRKAFGSENAQISSDDNGNIALVAGESKRNTVSVTENGVTIAGDNIVKETTSEKEVFARAMPFPFNMVPTLPRAIPDIPFRHMLPTIAIVGAAAAAITALSIKKKKNRN